MYQIKAKCGGAGDHPHPLSSKSFSTLQEVEEELVEILDNGTWPEGHPIEVHGDNGEIWVETEASSSGDEPLRLIRFQ